MHTYTHTYVFAYTHKMTKDIQLILNWAMTQLCSLSKESRDPTCFEHLICRLKSFAVFVYLEVQSPRTPAEIMLL